MEQDDMTAVIAWPRTVTHALRVHHAAAVAREAERRDEVRHAAAEATVRLRALRRAAEAAELVIFRDYVGVAVATASPLLARMCALHGCDLDGIAFGLRPRPGWVGTVRGPAGRRAAARPVVAGVSTTGRDFGFALIPGPGRSGLTFRAGLTGRGLELRAMLGACRLRTNGDTGVLTLSTHLPETVAAALPGMHLDEVVDHDVLRGAGAVIERVQDRGVDGQRIVFALKAQPWRAPWVLPT